jgi:APA family basic amino acid/polyamine antiporter
VSSAAEIFAPGPLPIISAVCEECGLVDVLNETLDWDEQRSHISPGLRLTGLIMNCLTEGQPSHPREVIVGSIVDTVVTEAECDVLVERIGAAAAGTPESILLPAAGGPHSAFAAEIAQAIARATDARIDVVRLVGPETTEEDREDAREHLEATTAAIEDAAVEHHIIEGTDVVSTLVEQSATYDPTIIGATREGLLQQLVFGTVPEELGRNADNTVIMAKRTLDLTSRTAHLLGRKRG